MSSPSLAARLFLPLLQRLDSEHRSRAPFPAAREDLVEWGRIVPFVMLHLGCLLVFQVGASAVAIGVAVALYVLRMFAITAVYHRGLSHRAFTCNRWLMFAGAFLAASGAQRGPLWWAAHHRRHHRFADSDKDAHSPHRHGLWWSHMGWFTTRRNYRTDHEQVADLLLFPELRWLDRFDLLAPLAMFAVLFGLGEVLAAWAPGLGTDGLQLLVWGGFVSTIVLFHATSTINSLGHVFGRRRYPTRDHSRNSLLLALLTFGEGWHNNHHWYPASARQGFFWWEVDLTFYALRLLSAIGVVRDLRPVPAARRSVATATEVSA